MYNAQLPEENELPSSRQLVMSTVAALVVAVILLFIAILPAEYGVDPTGIGKTLGLTEMGEIKMQLAEEAEQEELLEAQQSAKPQAKPEATIAENTIVERAQVEKIAEPVAMVEPAPALASDVVSVTLSKGQGAEIKLVMKEGATINYVWTVNKGHLNYDTHGDNPSIDYHGYGKGRAVKGDEGSITAVFDGKHGWFWRNRSDETVTLELKVEGEYEELKRVI